MSTALHVFLRVSITPGALMALLLGGCCPEVNPADGGLGDGALAIAPQLSALQDKLLDVHCVTDCHEGVNAASDLQLAKNKSYLNLINRASQQLTAQLRVVPGNPAASYLIKKMEGSQGIVGVQMPRLAPPRPQDETNALRAWIARGAPND